MGPREPGDLGAVLHVEGDVCDNDGWGCCRCVGESRTHKSEYLKSTRNPPGMFVWSIYSWGIVCEKQVSKAGISNYISTYTVGCNYLSLSLIAASGTQVLNYTQIAHKLWMFHCSCRDYYVY